MTRKVWQALLRFWITDRGLSVFLALLIVVVFVLPVLVPVGLFGKFIADLLFSLLLVAGVAAVSERRWAFVTVSAVAAAALFVRWTNWLLPAVPAANLAEWHALSRLVSFGLFSLVVLAQVFRRGPITVHRIQGAVAVYLLLGLAWAGAYDLLALHRPDAFAGAVGAQDTHQRWLYYSFVTLTTMGYGDITPVHPVARSLAVLEALVGQLYPAILLARLVSLEVEAGRQVAPKGRQIGARGPGDRSVIR
jgi:Ion channel